MGDNRLLCFGCGYTARALAARLLTENWRISGTTRSKEKADALARGSIEPMIWSNGFDSAALDDATALLVSTPPTEHGCPALTAAGAAIAERRNTISWIGYLSTNGVYGDHDGAWVDETSELKPTTERAHRRIAAEQAWRRFGEKCSLPVVIFRLPGIYGPGRSALDTVRAGKAKRLYKEGQVFSRAHVEDIAATLYASLSDPIAGNLFNIADNEPAPPQDVIEYACVLLGVDSPPLTPIEDADITDMARSFYRDNKRVKNDRMKERLGVTLKYPTYREGLEALLRE